MTYRYVASYVYKCYGIDQVNGPEYAKWIVYFRVLY